MGRRSEVLKSHGDDFAWSLLDAAPDATLVVSSTGEIVFANDHAGSVFGAELDRMLGMSVEELLPENLRSVHRAHRTRYRAEPTVRSMGAGLTLSARRFDGSLFPVEISLSPLRLGDEVFAVAAVRDITDRVESEDRMRRVLQTLDSSEDGMFMFDAESLRFSFVNQGAVRLVGYDADELMSMTPMHLNPYSAESDYRRIVDSLVADESATVMRQATMLRKDGVEVPVEKTYRAAPVGVDGRRWVIALARDISTRLAADAALQQSQQALHDAEQVVAIAEDRERIARDLHDTVIQRLFGEGLKLLATMNVVDERAKPRIQATIDGLDQTIKELRMAVFSLQGGETPQAAGLRGRLLAALTESTAGLGFEPRLQFEGSIDTIDSNIADNLVPVLREALSNISKHARANNVRVGISVDDEQIVLTIADDGVGIPQEVIGGHGLANMAERARRLGGDCSVVAQTGGGSLLTWHVPVRHHADSAPPAT
ncbi:MAG TPA: PAS domain-containing sensor histidine kinase [Ilumatobacteraceae bacterium]